MNRWPGSIPTCPFPLFPGYPASFSLLKHNSSRETVQKKSQALGSMGPQGVCGYNIPHDTTMMSYPDNEPISSQCGSHKTSHSPHGTLLRKPTVAILYKGETLKRLLDQRWTGHFGTVSVILRSFDDLSTLLREINSSPAYGADVLVEAAGLLRAMSEPSFRFIAEMVHKILSCLDPPNLMLQAEDMDLLTGVKLVNSACTCIENLHSETEFVTLLKRCKDATTEPVPNKRRCTLNTSFAMYAVEERIIYEDLSDETELRSCVQSETFTGPY
ncbi:hypothetical protein G5714_006131 [Onychostoma macrolepis]|uniref:Uncharacterized protein n=1 Tax=Onychostoma macrolepis TaxID=369639 RepID=A0A7J6D2Z6_9TELE|nr:hypothetical protein G5714_006131 [Onychostoma macrolepis]